MARPWTPLTSPSACRAADHSSGTAAWSTSDGRMESADDSRDARTLSYACSQPRRLRRPSADCSAVRTGAPRTISASQRHGSGSRGSGIRDQALPAVREQLADQPVRVPVRLRARREHRDVPEARHPLRGGDRRLAEPRRPREGHRDVSGLRGPERAAARRLHARRRHDRRRLVRRRHGGRCGLGRGCRDDDVDAGERHADLDRADRHRVDRQPDPDRGLHVHGRQGRTVYLQSKATCSGPLQWELLGPDGVPLDGSVVCNDLLREVLPSEGTYTVRVNADRNAMGAYGFSLLSVPATVVTPISLGQGVNGLTRCRGPVGGLHFRWVRARGRLCAARRRLHEPPAVDAAQPRRDTHR